ncbi:MAG: DivIVA domain-containing protein [Firmicutes bacterium]|nr:DivIVA domain-containing protein [Bacillota bacterium]
MLRPIDIHNAEFKRSFKGYNEQEVDAFLEKVVKAYEELFKENQMLREENEKLKESLTNSQSWQGDIQELVKITKETLTETKSIANKQATEIIENARLSAKRMLSEAEEEVQKVKDEIAVLRLKKQEMRERIRRTLETVWAMVEDNGEPDVNEVGNHEQTRVFKDFDTDEY